MTDEQLKGLHDVAVERSKKGWPQIRKSWADVAKALQELIELRKTPTIQDLAQQAIKGRLERTVN
jgi:hypothetical protein